MQATNPQFRWWDRDSTHPITAFRGVKDVDFPLLPLTHFGSFAVAREFADGAHKEWMLECDMAGDCSRKMPEIGIVESEMVIQRPLYLPDTGTRHFARELLEDVDSALARAGDRPFDKAFKDAVLHAADPKNETLSPLRRELRDWGLDDTRLNDRQIHQPAARLRIMEGLEARGYDGFVYRNTHEDVGHLSWVPFRPQQILSVERHRGFKAIHERGKLDDIDPPTTDKTSGFETSNWKIMRWACVTARQALDAAVERNGLLLIEMPEDKPEDTLRAAMHVIHDQRGPLPGAPNPKPIVISGGELQTCAVIAPDAIVDSVRPALADCTSKDGLCIGRGDAKTVRQAVAAAVLVNEEHRAKHTPAPRQAVGTAR